MLKFILVWLFTNKYIVEHSKGCIHRYVTIQCHGSSITGTIKHPINKFTLSLLINVPQKEITIPMPITEMGVYTVNDIKVWIVKR